MNLSWSNLVKIDHKSEAVISFCKSNSSSKQPIKVLWNVGAISTFLSLDKKDMFEIRKHVQLVHLNDDWQWVQNNIEAPR